MKNGRLKALGIAWAFLAGGIGGGVAWWVTGQIVVNGRSVVDGVGFPFNTPVPFALAGSLVSGISVLLSNRRSHALKEGLRDVALATGLDYEEGRIVVLPTSRPRTSVFGQWSRCENRLSGMSDGVPAQMFDLTAVSGAGDGTMQRAWTAVLFEETDLPAFSCLPNVWWTKANLLLLSPVHFDPHSGDAATRQIVSQFQKAYQVCLSEAATGVEEEDARRLFRAPLMSELIRHPGWCIQSADGCLILARRGIAPAEERAELWRDASELRRAILAPVSSSVVPIPAAPGMERGREENRRAGRAGGAIAGAALGFFGGFIAFATFAFGQTGRHSPLEIFAVFPTIIGGVVVGAVVGTWLGGRLADRSFRPPVDGGPVPGFARGWAIAGAFAGWTLGMVLGMVIVTSIPKPFHNARFMPAAFFSPPVLCMLFGGYVGNRFGRWLRARRRGAP